VLTIYASKLSSIRAGLVMKDKAASRAGCLTSCIPSFFLNQRAPKTRSGVDVIHRARTGPEFALQHQSVND
jgi:hypothetical protein